MKKLLFYIVAVALILIPAISSAEQCTETYYAWGKMTQWKQAGITKFLGDGHFETTLSCPENSSSITFVTFKWVYDPPTNRRMVNTITEHFKDGSKKVYEYNENSMCYRLIKAKE